MTMQPHLIDRIKARRASALPGDASIKDAWGWLKVTGTFLAVLSAAGALIGYGVALAYSSAYGLPTGAWYDNGLQLLELAGDGVLGLVGGLTTDARWGPFAWTMFSYWVATAVLIVLAWFVYWFASKRASSSANADKTSPPLQRLIRWLAEPQSNFGRHMLRGLAAAGVGGTVAAAGLVAGVIVIVVGLAAISVLPLLGFAGGMVYADKAVMSPGGCLAAPGARHEVRGQKTSGKIGALCVELPDPRTGKLMWGRSIVVRAQHVIVYVPADRQVVRIPFKDAVMSTSQGLSLQEPGGSVARAAAEAP
jgi:hypothetical protein